MNRILLALLGTWALATPSFARINIVTLPGRDTVQLTIYNSADLTLVKETRFLTFRKGVNKLEFSWANTLIDPTSVEFRALTHADGVDVLDVSFPPRVTDTLEWRINSDYSGDIIINVHATKIGKLWDGHFPVTIPIEDILHIAAEIIRNKRIAQLEQMETAELLK